MASFDVDALFTNIPLDETIDICVKKLFQNPETLVNPEILADIFLSHHDVNYLNKYPIEFKQSFYRRYVNDIFVLFELPASPHSCLKYMSSKHQNINFTVEHENIG